MEENWRRLYLNNNEQKHIKGIIHERKVDKLGSMKTEVFYSVEHTVKEMRRQEMESKKNANDICDKRLIQYIQRTHKMNQ